MNIPEEKKIEGSPKNLEDLSMDIAYDINKGTFEITGNLNKAGQKTVLEAFLSAQIGAGVDNREPIMRDIYNIKFRVDLSYDDIRVSDNIGNKGLRDGILMDVYSRLD